jgi:hypothetical protein
VIMCSTVAYQPERASEAPVDPTLIVSTEVYVYVIVGVLTGRA